MYIEGIINSLTLSQIKTRRQKNIKDRRGRQGCVLYILAMIHPSNKKLSESEAPKQVYVNKE